MFHAQEMRDREEFFSREVMDVLATFLQQGMVEVRRDVANLKAAMPLLSKDINNVLLNVTVLTGSLKWWRDK